MNLAIGVTTISAIAIPGAVLFACGGEAGTTAAAASPQSQRTHNPGNHNPRNHNPRNHNPRNHEKADNPCEPATQSTVDVTDWKSWTKVNRRRFLSKGHSEVWVDIYVPPENAAAYTDPSGSLHGMRIVQAQYTDEHTERAKSLTVMVRDESTETNWYWGVYAPSGKETMDAGQIDSCIYCHERAKDMLFRQLE